MKILSSAKDQDLKSSVKKWLQGHGIVPEVVSTLPPLLNGEVCLVLGAKHLGDLQMFGLVPKNRTITSLRGTAVPHHQGKILVSYDPSIGAIDYSKYVDLQIDVSMAVRLEKTGTLTPEIGEYEYVDSFEFLVQEVIKAKEPVYLSVDLETVGLDEVNPEVWIVSISFTVKTGSSYVMYFAGPDKQPTETVLEQIRYLLTTEKAKTVGANGKFDRRWIKKKWGLDWTNFKFDTNLVGSLLDENRSNSLNTHAKIYTGMGGYDDAFNRKYDKSRMDLVPKNDLLEYAGGDTDAALRVCLAQKNELTKDYALTRFYVELLHPASIALQYMEEEGLLIDVPYYMELESTLAAHADDIEEKALSLIPNRIKAKHKGALKLTRREILKDYLFTPQGLNIKPLMRSEKTQEPSTDKKHLALIHAQEESAKEFLDLMAEYNSVQKTLTTYVTGFMKFLRADGRLHPTAIPYRGDYEGDDSGTVTGRLSFKDPAVQTIPKHTRFASLLRKGYIAPPGYVIVNFDYSQGELRITACIANEPTMIALYKKGVDLHMVTGGHVNGYDEEDMARIKQEDPKLYKALRQGGKAGNFGLIYGMQAEGYQIYARDTYGVTITVEEANSQREAFFHLYPGLSKWHNDYKQRARQDRMIRSPLGRIRHLPLIRSPDRAVASKSERQAINSPVQATLSDLTLYSLALFHKAYGRPDGFRPCLTTHDSLTAYVKEDEIDLWVPRMRTLMEDLPLYKFDWYPQLVFKVDAESGKDMASMSEVV
jgi:DNA polymerase I-like protein with 3'-5' exonuclease and polymerase domains